MASQTNNDVFRLQNLFNVKDKVALVTGGGSGIGLMITQALAVNGAKVYIVGRTQQKLDTVAKTYDNDIPGNITPVSADISTKQGIIDLEKDISGKEKALHVLVNNAGINVANQAPKGESAEEIRRNLFEDETAQFDEDWATTYKTNVVAPYMMTTAFLPLLERGSTSTPGWSATVINITSISGAVLKSQGHFSYNASKAAANHVTRLLASEIGNHGIKVRVNAIAPGVYPSEMTTGGKSDEQQKSSLEKEKYAHLPARRPGKDEDMANAILFAATNQYLNGQVIAVDGGYLLKFGQ